MRPAGVPWRHGYRNERRIGLTPTDGIGLALPPAGDDRPRERDTDMNRIAQRMVRFFRDESAVTSTEHCLALVLIIVVLVAVIAVLGGKVTEMFADADKTWVTP